MSILGQLLLLVAFVASGYAAFAILVGRIRGYRAMSRSGDAAALISVLALTAVGGILVWALLVKDFGFHYVVQYSSRLLPWHYSLSAFWVGQAGSLLLWAWFSGMLAMAYRFWPRRESSPLREPAFGVLMAGFCFLVAIIVFAADPMQPSLATPEEGIGLSPLLQHPAMLIHPPVVFLAYAGWAVPFALALTALASGRLGTDWIKEARPWALFSWAVLGAGVLIGAYWAYEELGWGGYWAWDPVENGSLVPWLTGTALIHVAMAWQRRGVLKKTTMLLAVATFGLCCFATFLVRSGVLSSLHAFSESPVGWMFLLSTAAVVGGGGVLIVVRRAALSPEQPIGCVWSREAAVVLFATALLLLAAAVTVGTLAAPLSSLLSGQAITVGPAFYNNVLIPTGLLLLATTAVAPLLRWGKPPLPQQKRILLLSVVAAAVAVAIALGLGRRHLIVLAVAGLATSAAIAWTGALVLDVRRRASDGGASNLLKTLGKARRQYAGLLIHLSFVCLAIGVTGTALGTRRHEAVMDEGETIEWANHRIRYAGLIQRDLPDKHVVEAKLEIAPDGAASYTLLPAQHFHPLKNEWTTEVAIHSTWGGDFYTILHEGEGGNRVRLTLIENPAMRWIWFSGWVGGTGVLIGLWPHRRRTPRQSPPPAPKGIFRSQRRRRLTASSQPTGP